ncbi:unnamed protein product [Pichia kudriavzevii]
MLLLLIGDLYIPDKAPQLPAAFRKLLRPGNTANSSNPPHAHIDKLLCLGNITDSPSTVAFLRSLADESHLLRGAEDTHPAEKDTVLVHAGGFSIGAIGGNQVVPSGDPLALLAHARMLGADVLVYGGASAPEAYVLEGKFFVAPGSATGVLPATGSSADSADSADSAGGSTPSFSLLDVADGKCTLYVYTLVEGDIKVDRVVFAPQ